MNQLVVVKGAGDLATGIAHRLHRSGFKVVMTELPQPTVIRRTVAFAEAVFAGSTIVEGVTAVKTEIGAALWAVGQGQIAVVVDPGGHAVTLLKPWAVVDAIMAKKNTGTSITDASVVIGVGPGFTAGRDVHAVIESMRGHYLGKVLYDGTALADTGLPGDIDGYTEERLLRAPCEGMFMAVRDIASAVSAGDVVGYVDREPVIAAISGILRGILRNRLVVQAGMKIGDIDPRGLQDYCWCISDKARAIGGGVLEALLRTGLFNCDSDKSGQGVKQ